MPPKDPFAKIAKKDGTSSKKSTKIAASVTKKVKDAVEEVIEIKAQIKALKAKQDLAEQIIIEHVQPQQDAQARAGNYSKSFFVEGHKGSLVYTSSDKYSIDKNAEVYEAIEEFLGDNFDSFMKYVRTVALKPKVAENTTLVNKIIKACENAGISIDEAFDVKDVLVTLKDTDSKQFELSVDDLEQFRTLVRQYKASLK